MGSSPTSPVVGVLEWPQVHEVGLRPIFGRMDIGPASGYQYPYPYTPTEACLTAKDFPPGIIRFPSPFFMPTTEATGSPNER